MIDPYRADLPPVTATAAERRARVWLFEQKLPADEQSVALVVERHGVRRRAGFVLVVIVGAVVGGAVVAALRVDSRAFLPSLVVTFAVVPAGALLTQVFLWRRSDRRVAGWFESRLAPLRPPTWRDLVGPAAPRRAAALLLVLLLGAGIVAALGEAALAAGIVVAVLGSCLCAVGTVEFARRRPVVVGDASSYEVDNRFRGEQAKEAAEQLYMLFPLINGMSLLSEDSNGKYVGLSLGIFVAASHWLVVRSVRPRTPADPPPAGWTTTPTEAAR